MAIQLGTVAAIGFDDFPPAEWLGCFRQLGCSAVQAYRNQNARISVQQMQEAIAVGEMPCDSLHGIYGEEFDPSAPSESARRFAVDAFKSEGELALKLGGPLVIVHVATIREEGISDSERVTRIDQLRKSIAELGEFGHGLGVRYAFENLPGYHAIGWDVGELAGILAELGAPNTGLCYDTGHANMVGDAAGAVRGTGEQLMYVHFSDNSGTGDDHEMPTYGSIDCDAIARALHEEKYQGTMMLEVFHGVERLKQMIDEGTAERLARIVRIANGQGAHSAT